MSRLAAELLLIIWDSPQFPRVNSLLPRPPPSVLGLVPGGAAPLVVPDVVPVFGPAEKPGRLGQALPVLPLSVPLPGHFRRWGAAPKLGERLRSSVREPWWEQLASRWPAGEEHAGRRQRQSSRFFQPKHYQRLQWSSEELQLLLKHLVSFKISLYDLL